MHTHRIRTNESHADRSAGFSLSLVNNSRVFSISHHENRDKAQWPKPKPKTSSTTICLQIRQRSELVDQVIADRVTYAIIISSLAQ